MLFISKKIINAIEIYYNVPVTEAGQLELTLNGKSLDYTVVGRATGTNNILGLFIITTTIADSVITVRNPASNTT